MHKRLADICATEGFSFDASRWDSDTHHLIGFILTTIDRLEKKNNEQFQTIAELKSQIEGLTRATGQQTEKEKSLTLSDCLEHFKKNIDCKSEAAKKDVLRRVGAVVEKLGLRTRHCDVTKATILAAVKELCPNGETERIYKLRDVKRLFREISFAPESGVSDSQTRRRPSSRVLQRRRPSPSSTLARSARSRHWAPTGRPSPQLADSQGCVSPRPRALNGTCSTRRPESSTFAPRSTTRI